MKPSFARIFVLLFIVGQRAAAGDDGGLTREQIQLTVQTNMPSVNNCYEAGLKRHPDLNGKIRVKFEVSKSGSVSSATIEESELKVEQFEMCLIDEIKKWQFPAPVGGVSVSASYPFDFKKVGHKASSKTRP